MSEENKKLAHELWAEGCNNSYDILMGVHTEKSLYQKLKREPFILHDLTKPLIDTEVLREMANYFQSQKNLTKTKILLNYIQHIFLVDKLFISNERD